MPRKSKEELKNNNPTKNKPSNIINQNVSDSSTSDLEEKSSAKKTGKTSKSKISSASTKLKEKSASKTNSKKSNSKDTALSEKKLSKKSTTSKKAKTTSAKRSTTKRSKTEKKISTSKTKVSKNPIVEYYDLPYRYNETTVKILAQTPTMLFIYWDISDTDRASFIEKYGDDFFNKTKPILIVRNKTMNYSFEVEINDFANSWYLRVNDANCDYSVELGRRSIEFSTNIDNYVHVTTSNDMEMPNNHILFDMLGKSVFFKNVKTNFTEEIPITTISFIKRLGKVYSIYELYKEMYKEEFDSEELNSKEIRLNLSSSNSSTFM